MEELSPGQAVYTLKLARVNPIAHLSLRMLATCADWLDFAPGHSFLQFNSGTGHRVRHLLYNALRKLNRKWAVGHFIGTECKALTRKLYLIITGDNDINCLTITVRTKTIVRSQNIFVTNGRMFENTCDKNRLKSNINVCSICKDNVNQGICCFIMLLGCVDDKHSVSLF